MAMITRKQVAGTCSVCGGGARFYPAPVSDAQALAETPDDVETTGQWVHLDRADWVDDPHPVTPTG